MPGQARQLIGDNAVVIGALGIAIGAVVAAALPETKAENRAFGTASDDMKQAATDVAQSGLEAARDTTTSAVDAVANKVAEADLGAHASRMTQNIADATKEAATDVVNAALKPSSNSST